MNHFITYFLKDYEVPKYETNRRKSGYAECEVKNCCDPRPHYRTKKRRGTSFVHDKTIIGAVVHEELDILEATPLSFRLPFTPGSLPGYGDPIPLVASRNRGL